MQGVDLREYGGCVSSIHAGMVRGTKQAPVEGPNSYEQLIGKMILAWAGLRKWSRLCAAKTRGAVHTYLARVMPSVGTNNSLSSPYDHVCLSFSRSSHSYGTIASKVDTYGNRLLKCVRSESGMQVFSAYMQYTWLLNPELSPWSTRMTWITNNEGSCSSWLLCR